jgi:glycosyltransferase involved in cell wall biosynthesis
MSTGAIRTALLAAAGARLCYAALRRRPPGGRSAWARTNHRGESVTLLAGPAVAAAAVAAALAGRGGSGLSARQRAALAVAGAGAAAFGCYDDLAGGNDRRGFRGHLGALINGELTSGAVKIGGIGATAVAASALLAQARAGRTDGAARPAADASLADVIINATLIAGGANLLNLFDLRPGRAIKVAVAAGLPLAAGGGPLSQAAAAPLGAAVALLPEDLAERAMLGDAGANALGAMLGAAAAVKLPRAARLAVLAGIAGLTAASEVVSFTKVIERTAPLRWLDMLGRRPITAEQPRPPAVTLMLGTAAGGTARHVALLARGSARAGLGVKVIGPESTRPLFAGGEIGFTPVPILDRASPVRDAAAILRLRRLIIPGGPDVVHAHGVRAGAFAALALLLASRRPALVVTVHNAAPAGRRQALAYRILERICAVRADFVLCVSADLEDRMRGLGARATGRAVVPAPPLGRPQTAAVEQARSDLAADGRPVVLAVGRLAAQKGYRMLLDAAARWQRRDPRPLLAIAGQGPMAAELARAGQAMGIDLRLLGQRADVAALLAAADVFVVASTWEGQPLSVQEALQAGRPIVAVRVGGIADLTGADGALLVSPDDPGELAAAVVSVLDDRKLAGRLAAGARARSAGLPTEAEAVAAAITIYGRLRAGRGDGDGAVRAAPEAVRPRPTLRGRQK